MAFNKEMWSEDLAKNVYLQDDWYRIGKNWSDKVLGSIVHIPQAKQGIVPVKIDGSTTYPIATQEVSYNDLTFPNEMIVAPPRFITNINASEATFDTRTAEMEDITGFLRQAIATELILTWKPKVTSTGSITRTTGTSTRENIYGRANCKALTFADILAGRAKLVRSGVSLDNIYILVDPIMYSDLLQMDNFTNADELAIQTTNSAFVGVIAGMKVLQLAIGIPYNEDSSGLAEVSVASYTDSYTDAFSTALIVDGGKVGYALGTMENGEIKVGFEPYATGYYNDVLQAHTRVGGSTLYDADAASITKGVVAIIEED